MVVWTMFTGVVMIMCALITLIRVWLGVFMAVGVDMGMGMRMGVRAAAGVFMLMFVLVFVDVLVNLFRLVFASHLWFLAVVRPLRTGFGSKRLG